MCDDVFDDDVDCELELASKEYDKINDKLEKTGFRDGMMQAKDTFLQKGFDEGLEDSYENFAALNVLKGVANVIHFALDSQEAADTLKVIAIQISTLEQSLEDYENIDSKRVDLIAQLDSVKSSMKDLCSKLNLNSIHDQIDDCVFKFNEKALERLAAPLPRE